MTMDELPKEQTKYINEFRTNFQNVFLHIYECFEGSSKIIIKKILQKLNNN